MKRLLDIPDKLDGNIIKYSKIFGYPITQLIKQILWEWSERMDEKYNESEK